MFFNRIEVHMQKFGQIRANSKNGLKFDISRLCSQPFNCYELSWHTLFQECFWSCSKTRSTCFISSKSTCLCLMVLNPNNSAARVLNITTSQVNYMHWRVSTRKCLNMTICRFTLYAKLNLNVLEKYKFTCSWIILTGMVLICSPLYSSTEILLDDDPGLHPSGKRNVIKEK